MLSNPDSLPNPANREAASNGLERWREAAAGAGEADLARFAAELAGDDAGRRLLEAVFGNSPFLGRCLIAELGFVQSLLRAGPDESFSTLIKGLRAEFAAPIDDAAAMRALRAARRRTALLVGLADIAGRWPLERVTGALSEFADTALGCAVGHLLPDAGKGYVLFGMGKLGGRELNYSSDVDLIALYDSATAGADEAERLRAQFVGATRALVRMIEEHTGDGYVFRTDLRLRPDPGATPLAMSVGAAETYYESLGQNWERAALIKARAVAGDAAVGADFLDRIKPFIWRKNLDFAAIEDIHSIKRQIAAHRGGSRIAVAGHNVKLGRGGIREIEFFVQTQQLIFGGRDPSLRTVATCESLAALAAAGRVEAEIAEGLIESYRYLRRVEHRLQMIDDQQTHTIPKDEAGVTALAIFLGYADGDAFAADLLGHLHRVEDQYGALFEEAAPLAGSGNLVFTGGEHDPDTIETIAGLGFGDAERVSTIVRQWHHGRYRATSTVRARQILTELVPTLLAALARTANPDTALMRFDGFLAGLPAGVQLFSLFQANPHLLDLVAEIMGSAPYLAERLSRRPALFDGLLDADFMAGPPAAAELETTLAQAFAEARDFEDKLDASRRWTNERKFQMGMQILRGVTGGDAAGPALAAVADTVLAAIQDAVEEDFARRHGRIAGAGLCVIGYGKLGGRELMPGSDLDLVFVFDAPENADSSDGPKPLTPGHYFARLGQSLISAVTAPTGEGRLYEIDMRLRPSGGSGALTASLEGFTGYHAADAWTWEHMALTRARPVSGPAGLCARVAAEIAGIVTRRRDPARLVADVAAMRARLADHHQGKSIWDVKHHRGGLVDIEFLAQYLMLRHGAEHPEVLDTRATGALENLAAAGLIDADIAAELAATMRLWLRIHAILRLTLGAGALREDDLPEGLRRVLAKAGEAADFAALKAKMEAAAARAHGHFRTLVEEPAAAAKL